MAVPFAPPDPLRNTANGPPLCPEPGAPYRKGPAPSIAHHPIVTPLTVDGTVDTAYLLIDPWLLPKASEPELMQGAVNCLLADLEGKTDRKHAVRSQSQIGFMLICLCRNTEALQILQDCARAQESIQDHRGLIATQLRLVQACQASNDAAAAVEWGRAALARICAEPALSDLQHFAHHHLGKAQLQAGLYDEAGQHLHIALDSRVQMSDDALVSSTLAALSLLHRLTKLTDA